MEIVNQIKQLHTKADFLEKCADEAKEIQDAKDKQQIEDYKFQGQHLDGMIRLFQQGPTDPAMGGGGGAKAGVTS